MKGYLISGLIIIGLLFFYREQAHELSALRKERQEVRQQLRKVEVTNASLLSHIQEIQGLSERLDKFDAEQRKRTQQIRGDIAKTLVDDKCAASHVPDATRQLQRADQQRANDEIRAMFAP